MKKIFLTGLMTFVLAILSTQTALAQTKTKTTMVKLPVFMAGEIQTVDKNIDGDLMIAGEQVKITSDISGDVYVAGKEVEITGNIGGNLIVAGMHANISGKISKNLIMAGSQVVVSETASIGGYVLTGGNKVDLLGKFMGPVKLGAATLNVGQKAIINGALEADVTQSNIALDSKIVGEKNIRIHETKKVETSKKEFKKISYVGEGVSFLSKLLVLLIFVRLFGQKIKQINVKDSFWSAIGNGLLLMIVVPVLFFVLLVTVIAAPLSLIMMNVYIVGIYLSSMVVSILLGNYVAEKLNTKSNLYISAIVGLLLVTLVKMVPVASGLISFIIFLFGTGIIFKNLKTYFAKPSNK